MNYYDITPGIICLTPANIEKPGNRIAIEYRAVDECTTRDNPDTDCIEFEDNGADLKCLATAIFRDLVLQVDPLSGFDIYITVARYTASGNPDIDGEDVADALYSDGAINISVF